MGDLITTPGALDDLRVLDLTGEIGIYAAKLLADLGADVVRAEAPGGDDVRRIGPFYHDEPDQEKGLFHFLMNANKRSVTLNVEHSDGQDLLRRLVQRADVLLESYPPGYMAELGLGYRDLSALNPGLIMASITPFGQTGPYRHFRGPNIVGDAMGGLMYVTGSQDDPPLMSGANQAYYMVSMQAAVGVAMALYNRDVSGDGQYMDVSMQEAVALTVQPQAMFWPGKRENPGRFGYGQRTSGTPIYASSFYPCKDGWITGLGTQARGWVDMVAWLREEGAQDDLDDPKYEDEQERRRHAVHIQDVLSRFAAERTMEDLANGGQRHHLFVFPTYTARDVVADPHLRERDFFIAVPYPELGDTVTYPGPPYRLTETPWRIRRRAPRLGEHNTEVYHGELGIPRERLAALRMAGAI